VRFSYVRFLCSLGLLLSVASTAAGAQGDCGQPITSGASPTASDALAVLRTAVGSSACEICVCDVDGSGSIVASDALATLRRAVGQNVALACLACRVETTIGPEGGTLASGDGVVTIDFPPDALAAPTAVSIAGIALSALPAPASQASDGKAYDLGPDGLTLALPATVTAVVDSAPQAGEIGAELALMLGSDGDQLEVLESQGLFVDGDSETASATADVAHFSALAVLLTGIRVAVRGMPDSAVIDETHSLDAGVTDGDDALAVTSASYTDADFGVWQPADGNAITAAPLASVSATELAESFDYKCTGTALVFYSPSLDLAYDIDAGTFHVSGVAHQTKFRKTIDCHP